MTIAELRVVFIDRSGDINMANADVDRYINSGIEFLDLLTAYTHAPAKYYAELAAGESFHTFVNKCRVLKEAWIIDSVDGRSKMEKKTFSNIREQYPDMPSADQGKPGYYAIDINRAVPTDFDEANLPAAFQPFIDTSATAFNLKGVLFAPPADEVYVLELIGKFHSPALSDAYIENWWGVNYPDLVINAALFKLEAHYRNSEGMNDYLKDITLMVKGLDYDRAEEDSQDYTAMRG